MNTAITRDQFVSFRSEFRARSNNKEATPADHVLNNIICNAPIARGFSPVTNSRKLANGQLPTASVDVTVKGLKWAVRACKEGRSSNIRKYLFDANVVEVISEALEDYDGN